jgi:hypothetical protein
LDHGKLDTSNFLVVPTAFPVAFGNRKGQHFTKKKQGNGEKQLLIGEIILETGK